MYTFHRNFESWYHTATLPTLVMLLAAACPLSVRAQIPDALTPDAAAATPPYALFQYSTLTGSGNTITATWIPVVTSNGTTYKDVTIQFDVDSKGNLTIAAGYPQVVAAPTPLTSSFVAGTYGGPTAIYGGGMVITVSGPGIAPGGATEWSLASSASEKTNLTYPNSATWYVGPIASSPIAARLSKAGITSTAWYYGVGGSLDGEPWAANSLLGFSQVGKALTIVSFTDGTGDHSLPVGQVTYILSQ